jgi:hypothetical protein
MSTLVKYTDLSMLSFLVNMTLVDFREVWTHQYGRV